MPSLKDAREWILGLFPDLGASPSHVREAQYYHALLPHEDTIPPAQAVPDSAQEALGMRRILRMTDAHARLPRQQTRS